MSDSEKFARRVLRWFERHGRRDLPWQQDPTPYRVWVSEIMLQQTQVGTVVRYYREFMARFPTLNHLANASQDDVLSLWSGLGYYARGRNLHRTAQIVRDQYAGAMPVDAVILQCLPGIGRSTAGAIVALAAGRREPILDGNVKRVLARHAAVEGWPGQSAVSARLWALAERYTPDQQVASYTQAMMDLGALVCTRARPRCGDCPLSRDCQGRLSGDPGRYPGRKPKKNLPLRTARLLLICATGERRVLLEKRPPVGVWGGLWGFPECPAEQSAQEWIREHLGVVAGETQEWAVLRHTFSHFRLDMLPVKVAIADRPIQVHEVERLRWCDPRRPLAGGVAAPVQVLLDKLADAFGQ